MPVRCVLFDGALVPAMASEGAGWAALARRCAVGVIGDEAVGVTTAFRIAPAVTGMPSDDPRIVAMAAAAASCYPNEVVHVVLAGGRSGAESVGGRLLEAETTTEVLEALDRFDTAEQEAGARAGVGPHPRPWPQGDHLDPDLLAHGDRRNVIDRYRYWREEAVAADLDRRRHGFHVAVENWRHDRNIGAVVRNANAFGAAAVHIVGRRRWNRRGAMSTDRYLRVHHHSTVADFLRRMDAEGLSVIAVDNVAGSVPMESTVLPERCVLVFGQEGPGLSAEVLDRAESICAITQYGSTRSINAGVASGIAMYSWALRHAPGAGSPSGVTPP